MPLSVLLMLGSRGGTSGPTPASQLSKVIRRIQLRIPPDAEGARKFTNTQKRSNTDTHGVPNALDRFFGKLLKFPRWWWGSRILVRGLWPRVASAGIAKRNQFGDCWFEWPRCESRCDISIFIIL